MMKNRILVSRIPVQIFCPTLHFKDAEAASIVGRRPSPEIDASTRRNSREILPLSLHNASLLRYQYLSDRIIAARCTPWVWPLIVCFFDGGLRTPYPKQKQYLYLSIDRLVLVPLRTSKPHLPSPCHQSQRKAPPLYDALLSRTVCPIVTAAASLLEGSRGLSSQRCNYGIGRGEYRCCSAPCD